MLYRIFTERKPNLARLASRHFDGFTLTEATGYWQGQPEPSAVIEVILDGHPDDKARVYALANLIKHENLQQSVLVEILANTSELV